MDDDHKADAVASSDLRHIRSVDGVPRVWSATPNQS